MRAVRLTQTGLVQDNQLDVPTPGRNEALIRVSLAGICSTDLELIKGYYGFQGVLGHEFVGTVARAADTLWLGKRVVSSINFANTETPEFAQFGLEHHPRRTVLGILNHDGAMADYVCVPVANLYAVPAGMSDRTAVFTEPLAAALRIRQQVRVDPEARVCVLGPGRLGLLVAQVLSMSGTRVTVAGRSQASLALPARWGFVTRQANDLPQSHFDLVVDATGNPDGLATAIRITKPLGTILLKSTFEGAQAIDLTKVVVDEIKIIGSRCGPFGASLRLLETGRLDVEALIDGEYPIEQAYEAFDHASRPGVRKILVNLG